MSNDIFDVNALSEKLSKLNNSQQSIESLSRWCISHRKRARQIVETWDRTFNSSPKDQCVSFLYLANDILQNSRRKGSDFVNEFWKVLPAALKHVHDTGDEHGKKTVSRLVNIWEERKVFGSRGQNLKDDLLGNDPPPQTICNGKSSNPVKIVKKDALAIRIKLAVGGDVEKIVTAFHNFHDQSSTEEDALKKSNEAALSVERLKNDVENALGQGIHIGPEALDQLQDQESVLLQCVKHLEGTEATRLALVSQLKETLLDQEKQLKSVQSQLQVARSRLNLSENLRQRWSVSANTTVNPSAESMEVSKPISAVLQPPSGLQTSLSQPPTSSLQHPPLHSLNPHVDQPVTSFATTGGGTATTDEEKRAAAAAVAAKLAASTSSAQMLTSVLSSLVAEEAARSMSKMGLPPEKRQKLENALSSGGADTVLVSEAGGGNTSYYSPFMPTSSVGQPISHPPLPPLPPPANLPSNQFMPSSGMMLPALPFGYGSGNLPLAPPQSIPLTAPMGFARPSTQTQASPQPSNQQPQSARGNGGYYRPAGVGLYGQSQQGMTPSSLNLQ